MTIKIKNHELYDNTRLTDYKRCPRRYYYRHILNWVPNGKTPPALVFGSAWHAAMDTVWEILSKDIQTPPESVVASAMEAFMKVWRDEGYPEGDDLFGTGYEALLPRTPITAESMLYNYIGQRKALIGRVDLIATERPFIVPLSPDLSVLYIGKIDKTVFMEGRYSGIEHKTTSSYRKATGVNPDYMDSFSPNSQVDGYLHAGKMLYGDEFKSIFPDVALVHKTVQDKFEMREVNKLSDVLNEWLYDTRYWISQVQFAESSGYWPKNTGSCFDFNKPCPYTNLCRGMPFAAVQERAQDGPLTGFQEEQWNPVEELAINVENLDQYMKRKEE